MDQPMSYLNMPNFLIIGAPKSGTTSLFQYLRMHPEIFMSNLKEPNFFALEGKVINYQGPGDIRGNQCRITSLTAYQQLFASDKPYKAKGEASTVYLYSNIAAQNIAKYKPSMKMIAILRNPVDLAYSAFLHMQREGREPCSTFEEALACENERIKKNWGPLWHLTAQGYYAEQLQRYITHFPRQQLKIFFYEAWQSTPQSVIHDILEFLEVDSTIQLDTSNRFNESGKPKQLWLHHILTKNNPLKQILKPFLPKHLRRNMMAALTQKNLQKHTIPPMLKETRAMLQQRFYHDIKKLETLTNTDLSHWLQ